MKASYLKTICEVIGSGLRHPDYEWTKEYAEKLINLSTGDDDSASKLLRRVIKRETEEEFKQRVALTRLVTSSLWNRLNVPFNTAVGQDNANISIDVKEEKDIHDSFYNEMSVYKYIDEKVSPIAKIDPNAHLIITILPFDANKEKTKIRPHIVSSEDSLYFEYENEMLKLLVCNMGGVYKLYHRGSRDANGQLTIDCNGITATPVSSESAHTQWSQDFNYIGAVGNEAEKKTLFLKIGDVVYRLEDTDPKIEGIQAIRLGYAPYLKKKGRVMVSPFDNAVARIERTVKTTSELDISIAMHCFPQKIQMVAKCSGWLDEKGDRIQCQGGTLFGTNRTCPSCNGTGREQVHTSGMDVITIEMGAHADQDRKPSDMIHYAKPDIDTPKFLDEFLLKQEELCFQDIFPQNPTGKKAAMQTATEIQIDETNINKAIMPYVRQFENIWKFTMYTTLELNDIYEPKASIKFPDDIDIKTLGELLTDYKDSEGMPVAVRNNIRRKIARKLSAGDRYAERREAVRIVHQRFAGLTDANLKYAISQNLISMNDRILWANFDDIMSQCEAQFGDSWYNMTYDKREQAIALKIETIKSTLAPDITIP